MKNSNVINLEERIKQRFSACRTEITTIILETMKPFLTDVDKYYILGIYLICCSFDFLHFALKNMKNLDNKDVEYAIEMHKQAILNLEKFIK